MKKVIGIDIGGTKCAVILACVENNNIDILKKEKFDTDTNQPALEIIDKTLGGNVEAFSTERNLTEIEAAIIYNLMKNLMNPWMQHAKTTLKLQKFLKKHIKQE